MDTQIGQSAIDRARHCYSITTLTVVDWVMLPLVPVTVTVYVPAVVPPSPTAV